MASASKKKPSRAQRKEALAAAAAAVKVPERCDVAVIGGGAAGLVAATVAAEAGASVVVYERELECGRTILATGNGRCNFANEDLDAERYNDPAFVRAVCGDAWLSDVLGFWRGCGLAWTSEGGRLYPASLQAASVRNVLLERCCRAGVVLACGREVDAARGAGSIAASSPEDAAGSSVPRAASVVAATGGAGEPVLCPIAAHPADGDVSLAELDGRRARVQAELLRGGEVVFAEAGEVLFRPWGLSGIVMFDFSRRVRAGDVVRLDLTCGIPKAELVRLAPDGVLDPRIARALGGGRRALERARALDFVLEGLAETNKAQVKRGGLPTSDFDASTLASRTCPGFFACGEALDVDADCGGFNLAWAWKSGMVAGAAAARAALAARGALPGKDHTNDGGNEC